MSKPIVYFITIVVCVFFQMGIAPAITFAGATPNFLVIPVLLIALRSGAGAGGVAGFFLGLLFDLMGSGTVGCMALVFTITALVVGLLGSGMNLRSPLAVCLIVLVGALFIELAYGIANVLTSTAHGGILATLAFYSFPSAIYTTVFGCIALLTIGLVIEDDAPVMSGRLGGNIGGSAPRIPRMNSRLK